MASIGVKVIRGVFGAAEHVAPALAGGGAFELFCRTPSPANLSAGERRAVVRAEPFMAEARHHRLRTASGCVMLHEFRPRGGRAESSVLVVHGWRSRTEYMQALIEGLRDAGHRVFSLDLPGHGASTGRRLTMVNAVAAVRAAADWFGPFAGIVGHSFGGAVAVSAATGTIDGIAPVAAQRLVLIASPASLSAVFDDFGRMVNLGPKTRLAVDQRVQHLSGRPMAAFSGGRQLAELPIQTLVIHAPDDREVPADLARAYAGAGSHVRLVWAEGLGHRRILSAPSVVAETVGFVAAREPVAALH